MNGSNRSFKRVIEIHGRRLEIHGSNDGLDAQVIVGVTLHNQASCLNRCFNSIIDQENLAEAAVLVVNDNSSDLWRKSISRLTAGVRMVTATGVFGSPGATRNGLLDLVDILFPKAKWVARMDADDRFSSTDSLAQTIELAASKSAEFVLGGNRLCHEGKLLDYANPADESLLQARHVVERLRGMASGDPKAELPSCNLVLATRLGRRYPEHISGEDHWLVSKLLLTRGRHGAILQSPFYADYSLGGEATVRHRNERRYIESRRALLEEALAWKQE